MEDNKMDWDKYVKVFTLPIKDIEVKKVVSKSDVLMSLMSEGDVAVKLPDSQMVIKIVDINDLYVLKTIIWKPIEEYVRKKVKALKLTQNKESLIENETKN